MKDCNGCKYAEWAKTKNGRLHPSGDGDCSKLIKIPNIPNAFYYINKPTISGGYINRNRTFSTHCPYYEAI